MKKDLLKSYDAVVDEATFLAFLKALAADRRESMAAEEANPSSPYGSEAGGWENTTVEQFLEAGTAWVEASDFGRRMSFKDIELHDVSPWKRIAAFMMAAKVYE